MAQRALTSHGCQCAECHAIIGREEMFCPQCAAPFTDTFSAVLCDACGSFAERSRMRCPACQAELRHVEEDEVEEETGPLTHRLPLAAEVEGLAAAARKPAPQSERKPEREQDLEVSLQAAITLCDRAVDAALRENSLWDGSGLTKGKLDELRRALSAASETLHDLRRLLSSPKGIDMVADAASRDEIRRLRGRETDLERENESLRRMIATKEVLLMMAEDDLVTRLRDDLGPRAKPSPPAADIGMVRSVLDTVGAMLSRLPGNLVAQLQGTDEFAAYQRLVRLYVVGDRPASSSMTVSGTGPVRRPPVG